MWQLELLDLVERALRAIWRFRYRIPPGVFWAALIGGAVALFFVSLNAIIWPLLVAAVGAGGVLHWRRHRRRPILLLVPRVETYGNEDQGRHVQDLVLNTLRRSLTKDEMTLVEPLAVVVGPADTAFAHLLLRRCRALYTLYGRTETRADGGWSVLAGLAQEIPREVIHVDWHTRDRTPGRRNRDVLWDRLSPTRAVEDVDDPLAFTSELEALVRGLAGRLAAMVGDDERAERELRAAIAVSADSPAHPIDALRAALAAVIRRLGRRDEALVVLRDRRARGNASPELLRALAFHLGPFPGEFETHADEDPRDRAEAIAALREAAEHRSDPQRSTTLYNLAVWLDGGPDEETEEANNLYDELMATDRYYRRAWYVHREKGALHWHRGSRLREAGHEQHASAEFKRAARWYSSALRARPKIRFNYFADGRRYRWLRFPPSPVLLANARDAHREAGHDLRARFYGWRTNRQRLKRLNKALKHADRGEWARAYGSFDFASVGEHDVIEAAARTLRAIALKQMSEDTAAEQDWAATRAELPGARFLMAEAARTAEIYPQGLPGNEPADPEQVAEQLRAEGHDELADSWRPLYKPESA